MSYKRKTDEEIDAEAIAEYQRLIDGLTKRGVKFDSFPAAVEPDPDARMRIESALRLAREGKRVLDAEAEIVRLEKKIEGLELKISHMQVCQDSRCKICDRLYGR